MWYQKLKKQKPHLERSEELSQRLEKKKKKETPERWKIEEKWLEN